MSFGTIIIIVILVILGYRYYNENSVTIQPTILPQMGPPLIALPEPEMVPQMVPITVA